MIFKNPEFKKNIKLEFSATRLLIPALLLLLAVWIGWGTGSTKSWSVLPATYKQGQSLTFWMFGFGFIFSIIWGSYLASNSLFGEMRQKTWDFMRMSSLRPEKILFGKLFGATSVVWVITLLGILPILLVASDYLFIGGGYHRPAIHVITSLFSALIFWMILSYSFVMLAGVYNYSRDSRHTTIGAVLLVLVMGLFIGGFISTNYAEEFKISEACTSYRVVGKLGPMQCIVQNPYIIDGVKYTLGKVDMVDWYGFQLFSLDALAFTLIFAGCWSVMALYRTLRSSLQYMDTPYIWPIFLTTTALFINGFFYSNVVFKDYAKISAIFFALSIIPVCIKEAGNKIAYRQLYESLKNKNYKDAFRLTPLWAISFAFFAILSPIISLDSNSFLGFYIACLLYLVRDILAIHVISWRKSVRMPIVGISLYLFLIYVLLPLITRSSLWESSDRLVLHIAIILGLLIPFRKGLKTIMGREL